MIGERSVKDECCDLCFGTELFDSLLLLLPHHLANRTIASLTTQWRMFLRQVTSHVSGHRWYFGLLGAKDNGKYYREVIEKDCTD